MYDIKFGTDGWRAVIAKEYTVDNVARLSQGVAKWLINSLPDKEIRIVVIGYDCRFGSKMFAEIAAKVLACNDISVYLSDDIATTPMVSYGVLALEADLGIVITASHNGPEYNGFKVKGSYGGPLFDAQISEIEELIPEFNPGNVDRIDLNDLIDQDMLEYVSLEDLYYQKIEESFNLDEIRKSDLNFCFDPMYGAGQKIMRKIFPKIHHIHSEMNPGFCGISPEPLEKNLKELINIVSQSEQLSFGVAVDGDADRIALISEKGEYIDSHHVMLLLIHCLCKYKKMNGKVITGVSSTSKMDRICKHYNLDLIRVKIGFKNIAEYFRNEDVLLGGEESGGIAIKGFIPERDGVWNALTIIDFVVSTGKSLYELLLEVDRIVGSFVYERSDLKITEDQKKRIVRACNEGKFSAFGNYKVRNVDLTDGFKYFFNDDEWVMIRPSGTEPVLRTYAESFDKESVLNILNACYETIINV